MNNLSSAEKQLRMNIRNFLVTATKEELEKELQISIERNDKFRAKCIQELLDEMTPTE